MYTRVIRVNKEYLHLCVLDFPGSFFFTGQTLKNGRKPMNLHLFSSKREMVIDSVRFSIEHSVSA